MSQVTRTTVSNLKPLVVNYLSRANEIRSALARWNQTEIPELQMPPPGTGYKIRFGPGKGLEMKLRKMHGVFRINDHQYLLSFNPINMIVSGLVRQIKETERYYGYMARPRNYYLLDSFEVRIIAEDWDYQVKIGWVCHWVVMPKSWRKKLWKMRQKAAE